MVNGSFKCFGSTQHIKNKFGFGFEVELKISTPTDEEIKAKIAEIHYAEGHMFNKEGVNELLASLNLNHLIDEVSAKGHAADIYAQV